MSAELTWSEWVDLFNAEMEHLGAGSLWSFSSWTKEQTARIGFERYADPIKYARYTHAREVCED